MSCSLNKPSTRAKRIVGDCLKKWKKNFIQRIKRYVYTHTHHQTINDDAFFAPPFRLSSFICSLSLFFLSHRLYTRDYINIMLSAKGLFATFHVCLGAGVSALVRSQCFFFSLHFAIRNTTLFVSWVRNVPSNRYTNTKWANTGNVAAGVCVCVWLEPGVVSTLCRGFRCWCFFCCNFFFVLAFSHWLLNLHILLHTMTDHPAAGLR